MDITNLKQEELLKLKKDIDVQLVQLEKLKKEKKKLKDKSTLEGLKNGDKIFAIIFNGSKIYHMDFVKIEFHKSKDDTWRDYSTSHKTKPMGCSSSIQVNQMNKHYFLEIFPSSMDFYTLKPETWETDLRLAFDNKMELETINFNKNITKLKTKVEDLISNNNITELYNNL